MRNSGESICAAAFLTLMSLTCSFSQAPQSPSQSPRTISTVEFPGKLSERGAEAASAAIPAANSLPATTIDPSLPESFFDAVNNTFKPVTASVEIHANEQGLDTGSPSPLQAGG